MAALRIQGLVDADNYDHAVSIFKSLQAQTGHTVKFQEAAFSEAVEYIKSYHPIISSLLLKNIVAIAEGYELPGIELDDSQLFESVVKIMHAEQDGSGDSSGINEESSTESCGIGPDSRA